MTRKVNDATLSHIKSFEGLRLQAYPDPGSRNGDPWTIGYGSTTGVHKGMVITEAEAEQRLKRDLETAERAVELAVKVPLNDNQFGALVSFAFNVGAGAFRDSTLLRKLNAKDYSAVPAQLARWNKNDGKVIAGLTRRRASEAELWNTPAGNPAGQPAQPIPIDLPDEHEPAPAAKSKSPIGFIVGVVVVIAIIAGIVLLTPIF